MDFGHFSTSGWVTTWMADRLLTGKPSQYVTSHYRSTQPSIPPGKIGQSSTGPPVWLGLRRGVFTCVGWQVTLCSCVMGYVSLTAIQYHLTFTFEWQDPVASTASQLRSKPHFLEGQGNFRGHGINLDIAAFFAMHCHPTQVYTPSQCSRKRVQQLKECKSHVFFGFWKNVKNVKQESLAIAKMTARCALCIPTSYSP